MPGNKFMEKALEIAERGRLFVSPNPMVGTVIVKNGKIIASGWHRSFGGEHAEVAALRKAGRNAKGAVMYVSLEPCCHYGKQPPCTKKIIESGIRKVVVAARDPNPVVDGRGIKELRKAGIEVGVLHMKEAVSLNRKYFRFRESGRPFVLLKLAMTSDGKITWGNGRRKLISGKESMVLAHRLRSEYDAVLVGINTILKDNPRLTCRLVEGRNPVRVVVDSEARVPLDANVLKGYAGTIIACTKKAHAGKVRKLQDIGIGVLVVKQKRGQVDLSNLVSQLGMAGFTGILVEGGAQVAASFIEQGVADAFVFAVSEKISGTGADAFSSRHVKRLFPGKVYRLGNDVIVEGFIGRKRPRIK